jgi:hypothetical protein
MFIAMLNLETFTYLSFKKTLPVEEDMFVLVHKKAI